MSSVDGSKMGSNVRLSDINTNLPDVKIEATDDGGFIIAGKDDDVLGDLRFYKYNSDYKFICSNIVRNAYTKTGF